MSQSSAGVRAGSSPIRRRGRGGRSVLSPLPNPGEQDRSRAEADARARALVADAAAAGAPLRDVNGNRRSHVTLPEYRAGRAPENKGRRYPAEVLTSGEVLAILDQLPGGKTGQRNRALIVVMWRAGLRIAEALALEPRDVDLERGTLTVRRGKGSKRRVVAIDAGTGRHLAELLARRVQLGLEDPQLRERLELDEDEEVPVFCTLSRPGLGRPMHSSVVREMLKLYARHAGIRKPVRPHGLRHTFAFEASQEGLPIAVIQEQLGHQDLAMTDHYVRHLAPAHLIERIGARAFPGDPATALWAGQPVPTSTHREPKPKQPPRGVAHLAVQRRRRLTDAILRELAAGEPRSTSELAQQCEVPRWNALRVLHRMHDEQLVARVGLDAHRGGFQWKATPAQATFTSQPPRAYTPAGGPLPRMLDAISTLGGRASQAQLGRLLELAPSTVQGYCRELEAQGALERGGLDKSTSRRGSQVWRLPQPKSRYRSAGGYTMTVRVPR